VQYAARMERDAQKNQNLPSKPGLRNRQKPNRKSGRADMFYTSVEAPGAIRTTLRQVQHLRRGPYCRNVPFYGQGVGASAAVPGAPAPGASGPGRPRPPARAPGQHAQAPAGQSAHRHRTAGRDAPACLAAYGTSSKAVQAMDANPGPADGDSPAPNHQFGYAIARGRDPDAGRNMVASPAAANADADTASSISAANISPTTARSHQLTRADHPTMNNR